MNCMDSKCLCHGGQKGHNGHQSGKHAHSTYGRRPGIAESLRLTHLWPFGCTDPEQLVYVETTAQSLRADDRQ